MGLLLVKTILNTQNIIKYMSKGTKMDKFFPRRSFSFFIGIIMKILNEFLSTPKILNIYREKHRNGTYIIAKGKMYSKYVDLNFISMANEMPLRIISIINCMRNIGFRRYPIKPAAATAPVSSDTNGGFQVIIDPFFLRLAHVLFFLILIF